MIQETFIKQAVIQMLPTAGLGVPDWNPRKFMDEGEMAGLTAYLKKGGFVPRIFVWAGDGKSVISGQRRLEAYKRLGWTQIEAEILDISLEEAKVLAITSNEGAEVYWLDKYESWEPFMAKDRGLTEDEVGDKLGVAKAWIRRADALMNVLNGTARKLIRQTLQETTVKGDAKNKGNNDIVQSLQNDTETLKKRTLEKPKKWMLNEDTAFHLTQLWDKRSLEDAQTLVEKALPVILARQMTASQVDGLVGWVKNGNSLETFNLSGKSAKGERSKSRSQERPALGTPDPPATPVNSNDSLPLHLDTFKPSPNAVGAQIGSLIAGKELAKRLHLPAQALNGLLPTFARHFQRVIALFERLINSVLSRKFNGFVGTQGSFPVKASTGNNVRVAATILALFLVLFVGSTLIGWSNRLMGWVVSYWAYSGVHPVVSDRRESNPSTSAQSVQSNQAQVSQPAPSGSGALQQALPIKSNEPALRTVEGSNGPKSEVQATSVTQKGTSTQGQLGGETKKDLSPVAGAVANGSVKGVDPLKAIGDGVKDATDAVNKAKEGQSDVDKVKNLFGF